MTYSMWKIRLHCTNISKTGKKVELESFFDYQLNFPISLDLSKLISHFSTLTITFQFHVEFSNSTFFQLNFPTTRNLFRLKYLTSEIDLFQIVYKTRPSKSDSKLDCDFKFRNRLIFIYRQLQIAIWSWMHQIQSYKKLVDQTKIRRKFQINK